MRKAFHPERDEKITVCQYIEDCDADCSVLSECARCPVCKQPLIVVAGSATGSIPHFSHKKNSGFCPTKSQSAEPYRGLPPRNPDPEAAKRIKRDFLTNWPKHYSMLNWIVKGLAADEFLDVIRAANRERIWEYAQLEVFQLPYVFATMMDFSPARSYKDKQGLPVRKKWFRCWFDATVQRYDDLWIHRKSPLVFWRAWYELPSGKTKPRVEDLIDSYGMELTDDFLKYEVNLPAFLEARIANWLKKHLQVD